MLSRAARCLAVATVASGAPLAAQPQGADQLLSMGTLPPVVTIDQERLFVDSAFGRRVTRTLETAAQALSEENRAFEEMLSAEERALAEQRGDMAPDEFRQLADAFDTRVEGIRRAQEAKSRALGEFRDAEQQRFFEAALPVAAQVLTESGAVAVLDSRAILLAVDEIDITDRVIARLDAQLGDGAEEAASPFDATPAPGPGRVAPSSRPGPRGETNGGPPLALPDPPDAMAPPTPE